MAEKIKLLLILFLATGIGFFRLGSVPAGLSWDETAIGWNAKTIWFMHLDEFGTRWPVSFRSFNDYKAPLYIYLTAPVVGLLGSTETAVRLLSVVAGVVSVGLMFALGGKTAAALTAITPWHVLLARPAFEANLALMFILAGVWLWRLGVKKPVWLIFAAISFGLSLYSYQAPKIFVPVFIGGLIWIYRQELKQVRRWLFLAGLAAGIMIWPLIKDSLGMGGERFKMTSIFYRQESGIVLTLAKNYLAHFSPRWLFFSGGETGRSQMSQTGMLLLLTLPFLVTGLIELWRRRRENWPKTLWWWLITAPLPAAVGFEAPHAIRAYQLLPVLILIIVLGLNRIKKYKLLIFGLLAINAAVMLFYYFTVYPAESGRQWQYGYKQAAAVAAEWEDRVDKIIFTSAYGQPYVLTYWYQDRDPQAVFWGGMIKYLFRPVKLEGDWLIPNALIIGAPEEIPSDYPGIIKEINFPDGSVAFRVVKT